MSRITVFTPTYNRMHFQNRVYESLILQTVLDFEGVTVYDGSINKTRNLKNNGGKLSAITTGLKKVQAEFFLKADSDDIFEKWSIEIFLNYFNYIT